MTEALERSIAALFGPDVAVVSLAVAGDHPALLPEEMPAVARAVPTRRAEFTAGRAAARRAMQRLDLAPVAIPAAPDRSPLWPAGVTGSISHAAGFCAVALSRNTNWSLGLDIEDPAPLDADLWPVVLTPDELMGLERLRPPDRGFVAKRIFGIKEAVYKAQFVRTGALISFQTLNVRMTDPEATGKGPGHAVVNCTKTGSMIPGLPELFPDQGRICRIQGPSPDTANLLIAAISLPG
jgi:enterobactin synthetase component D